MEKSTFGWIDFLIPRVMFASPGNFEVSRFNCISRAWCKTIGTTSFYIRSYNSFAPSPRYILCHKFNKSTHVIAVSPKFTFWTTSNKYCITLQLCFDCFSYTAPPRPPIQGEDNPHLSLVSSLPCHCDNGGLPCVSVLLPADPPTFLHSTRLSRKYEPSVWHWWPQNKLPDH